MTSIKLNPYEKAQLGKKQDPLIFDWQRDSRLENER